MAPTDDPSEYEAAAAAGGSVVPARSDAAESADISSSTSGLGRGHPLNDSVRARFETRIGTDLSRVRLHTDSSAHESAARLKAKAYTVGEHVVFGHGHFAPNTVDGDALLTHELTHVRQHVDRGEFGIVHRAPLPKDVADSPGHQKLLQAIGLAHWNQAAELLNREYSPEDIKAVVETLNAQQIQSIYLAAVGDVAVGDGSKVATTILATSQTLSAARSTILASGITMKEFVDFDTKSSSELQDQYPSQRFIAINNSRRTLPTSVLYMKMSTEKTIPNPPQAAPPPKRPDFGASLPAEVTGSPQHQQLTSFIHNHRWQDTAVLLNSYRKEHILALLPDLATQQAESIYLGAIAHNGVGEGADVAKTIIGASPDLQAARAEVTAAGISIKEYVDFLVNPPMVGEQWFGRKRAIRKVIENLSAKSLSHLQFATDQTVYMFRSGRTGTIAEERDRRVAEFKPKGAVAGLAEAGTRAITGDEDRAEHVGAFTENLTDAGLAVAPVVGSGVAKARGMGGGTPGGTKLPAKLASTSAAAPKPAPSPASPAPATRAPEPVRSGTSGTPPATRAPEPARTAAAGPRGTAGGGPAASGAELQIVTGSSSQRGRPPPPPMGLPLDLTYSRLAGEMPLQPTIVGPQNGPASPTTTNGKSNGAAGFDGALLRAQLTYGGLARGPAIQTPVKPGHAVIGGREIPAADLRLGGKPVAAQGPIVTGGKMVSTTNSSLPPDARPVVGVIAAEAGDVYLVVSVPAVPAYTPGAGPATPVHAPGTSHAPAALPGVPTPGPVRDPTPQHPVEAPGVSKEPVQLAARRKAAGEEPDATGGTEGKKQNPKKATPKAAKPDPRAGQKEILQKQIDAAMETRLQIFGEIERASKPGKDRPSLAEREDLQREGREIGDKLEDLRNRLADLETTPYGKARAYSYSNSAATDVLRRSRGLDEMSGKKAIEPSIDHVVPIEEMVEYEGWNELSPEDQRSFLSRRDNLRLMEKRLNSSKGGKRWADWESGRRFYGDEVWNRMVQTETSLREVIREDIKARAARARR